MLELAVLNNDSEAAVDYLSHSLAAVREFWEPETTENNLQLIADARSKRNEEIPWLIQIIEALPKKIGKV